MQERIGIPRRIGKSEESKLKSRFLAEPILVGREKELEQLQLCLDSAVEGKGKAVFVSGEAGVGKTRLINEFLSKESKKGMTVLSGWCLSDAATPYFPFVEAFNSYFSRLDEEQPASSQESWEPKDFARTTPAAGVDRGITAWLAMPRPVERTGRPETHSPEIWKDQVFAGVARTLHEISSHEPIIFLIEDIHWADSASLALLHYVARSVHDSEKILILGTFRSEELTADSEGRSHPLVETLRLMKREDLFREIKLSDLGQHCVGVIARSMLGGTLDSELVERLTAQSKGNALFVVESLRMWSERGSLVQEGEGLRLAVDELDVPSKFKDIILRRLGSLKFGQRRMLDVASVVGEKFSPDLLGFVLGKDGLEVLETLDEVSQSTRLVYPEEDFYRFDHARTREILYQEISSPLKKGYHAKIAQGLETKIKVEKAPPSSLAYHYAQAGNKEKAVEYALEAGEDALDRFGNLEAIKSFEYVLSATEEELGCYDQKIRALSGLGNALEYGGFWAEATRIYEKLANFAESGVEKLRALSRAMGTSLSSLGITHVLELAAIAENYAQFDKLEYARVRMGKARAMSNRGEIEQALKETKEALRVFEEEGSLSDIAQALQHMTMYYARTDKTPVENALALTLRSAALNKEVGNLRLSARFDSHLALMFMSCGLFEKAIELYTSAVKIDEKVGAQSGVATVCYWLGFLFEARGLLKSQSENLSEGIEDFKTGIHHSLKGVQAAEKTDDAPTKMLNYGNLVRLYVKLKEMDKAEEFFKKLETTYDRKNMELLWGLGHYFRSKAVFLTAKGHWAEANGFFEESLASFKNFAGLAFPMFVAETRMAYAESLADQGMIEESKLQVEKAKVIIDKFVECREKVGNANVRASLLTRREIGVGEEFKMRIDLVNAASNSAIIVRLEDIVPPDFKVIDMPSYSKIQNGFVEMSAKKIGPFQVEPVTLVLIAQKAGAYALNPRVVYSDHLGETRALELEAITITVRPTISVPILPGRVATGFADLDVLLFGGIPEDCAVMLASSSADERALLVKKFLETGAKAGEATFHVTVEVGSATRVLAEKYPSNFILFLCNPQADTMIQNLPNVYKLKGVENLTDIDIVLTKAFRTLKPSATGPRRICIDIISDVLLQHHAVNTRRWLSSLLPTLKAKGFTILAVIDPRMHPGEEIQAVLGLFDGEINIYEKETPKGLTSFLKIKRMTGQKYLKDELPLTEE